MLESRMQERLPDSCNLDPKHFDHVLNVVAIDGRFHWNVHEADSTYRQTVLLTQPSLREVSSAVHKLQEALAVLGHKQGCEEAAIDLGKHTLPHSASLRSSVLSNTTQASTTECWHLPGSQVKGMHTAQSLYVLSHRVIIGLC